MTPRELGLYRSQCEAEKALQQIQIDRLKEQIGLFRDSSLTIAVKPFEGDADFLLAPVKKRPGYNYRATQMAAAEGEEGQTSFGLIELEDPKLRFLAGFYVHNAGNTILAAIQPQDNFLLNRPLKDPAPESYGALLPCELAVFEWPGYLSCVSFRQPGQKDLDVYNFQDTAQDVARVLRDALKTVTDQAACPAIKRSGPFILPKPGNNP